MKRRKSAPPPDWVKSFIVYYATERAMAPAGVGHATQEIASLLTGMRSYSQKIDLLSQFGLYVELTGAPVTETDGSFAKLYAWVPEVLRWEIAGYDTPPAILTLLEQSDQDFAKKPSSEKMPYAQLLCRAVRARHADMIQLSDMLLQQSLKWSFERRHNIPFSEFSESILNYATKSHNFDEMVPQRV